MYVHIDDSDRIVLRYEVPADESGRISGSTLIVIHDIEVTGTYYVLFHAHTVEDLGQFDIMWKGSLETCLEKFGDEVHTWEIDAGMTPAPK